MVPVPACLRHGGRRAEGFWSSGGNDHATTGARASLPKRDGRISRREIKPGQGAPKCDRAAWGLWAWLRSTTSNRYAPRPANFRPTHAGLSCATGIRLEKRRLELAFPWPYSQGEWLAWWAALATVLFGLLMFFAPAASLRILTAAPPQTLHPEAVGGRGRRMAGFYLGLGLSCLLPGAADALPGARPVMGLYRLRPARLHPVGPGQYCL